MVDTISHPEPFTKIPPTVAEKKPGQLTPEQIKQFYQDGFVIIKDYFTPEELQPCLNDIEEMVDDLAVKLYNAGKISKLYEEHGVFQRLTMLNNEFSGATTLLFKMGRFPKSFQTLWSCEKFLNMNEQLLGSDVAGHPVWNLREKTPDSTIMDLPWHQDSAYFDKGSYDHMVVIAWVPFLDTGDFNGGMQIVKGGHRKGRIAPHSCCYQDTWYISLDEREMEETLGVKLQSDIVSCDVPLGSILLFNNLTPHRSVHNNSNDVRWSIDFRWQSPNEKWGYYDIQEGIIFRKEGLNVNPDWDKFLSVNRKRVWEKRYKKENQVVDEFDTTVNGPWIGNWPIVNENRHTRAFRKVTQT